MKLQHFAFVVLLFAGSLTALNTAASSFNEVRVRTVPHAEADQKKKEETKSSQTKTQAPPSSIKTTSTSEKSCSQSQILKTTAWVATGSTPK